MQHRELPVPLPIIFNDIHFAELVIDFKKIVGLKMRGYYFLVKFPTIVKLVFASSI